jgi:hypothetical protein
MTQIMFNSAVALLIAFVPQMAGCRREGPPPAASAALPGLPVTVVYPLHHSITATVFWVGEPPAAHSPTNSSSAWDEHWEAHFGGFDDPHHRSGSLPAAFTPSENPFYVALPYNDLLHGHRRPGVEQVIPWAGARTWGARESICKNRWVMIQKNQRVCYAQWEDVGPFNSDDGGYVFGKAQPKNHKNRNAGLDVSPAVRDELHLSGMETVDWKFVNDADVPQGPWRQVVTKSQVSW